MQFRILGPLEVVDEAGLQLSLGGGRQRALVAVLLLHANEVVSSDHLIQELWGDKPPESAAKLLQGHVSQVRRAIDGDARLVTRQPGYMLRVEPGELDGERFERLVDEGRRALARGAADEAAGNFREALSLWRGAPLAEFTSDEFAQGEIARLEEVRLTALEDLMDAELALGRHAALVGELEPLVAQHPWRERLRAQLMLALYRSGRQAEALQAYQEARRVLVEELGIEPSETLRLLERAVLTHDPSLEAPPTVPTEEKRAEMLAPAGPSAGRRFRPRWLAILGGVGLLAAGALAAALILVTRGESAPVVVPNSLVKLDPRTNKVVAVIRVGRNPTAVATDDDSVWVVNDQDQTLSRVDMGSGDVQTSGGLQEPLAIAVEGDRHLWLTSHTGEVLRLDPISLYVEHKVRLPAAFFPAVGGRSVWISQPTGNPDIRIAPSTPGTVSRIDLATSEVEATIRVGAVPREVNYGDGAAWVAIQVGASVSRIDPRNNRVERIPVGRDPVAVAVGFGAVWVAGGLGRGTVWRIDSATREVDAVIPVGRTPFDVATGAGAVWVTHWQDGTVSRIDPRTSSVVKTIRLGFHPHALAFGGGALWVAVGQ